MTGFTVAEFLGEESIKSGFSSLKTDSLFGLEREGGSWQVVSEGHRVGGCLHNAGHMKESSKCHGKAA